MLLRPARAVPRPSGTGCGLESSLEYLVMLCLCSGVIGDGLLHSLSLKVSHQEKRQENKCCGVECMEDCEVGKATVTTEEAIDV